MRKIKYFDQFNESRQQMEIPFDNGHPIHDKPVHVHLQDALKDLEVMPAYRYTSSENLSDIIEGAIEETKARIIKGEESISDIRIEFAFNNLPWENPKLWKRQVMKDNDVPTRTSQVAADSEGALSDLVTSFDFGSMSDLLTAEGMTMWEEHLFSVVNDNVQDMLENLEQDDDGLIDIWRAVTLSKDTDRGKYADVYNAITKGYKGVGVYWSWDDDAAEAHWGHGKDSVYIKMHAKVRPDDVDWPETLFKNTYDLKDEKEIRVKDGGLVKVIGFMQDDKYVDIDPKVVSAGKSEWSLPDLD